MPAIPALHDLLKFAQFHACQFNWHPTISSSVTLSCLQSFPAAGSFPVSRLFASDGQSIGASASVLLKSIQSCLPLALTGLMSFFVQETLKSLLQHHNLKTSIPQHSAFFIVTSVHDYWKDHKLEYMDLCWQSDIFAF